MTAAIALPGIEDRQADLRGVRLRYLTGGSGDPLLLLHGLGGAAANWIELLPSALERYRVLAPDLPGHGRSGRLPACADVTAFADVVAGLVEREAAAPALVAGHSFGGLIALRLAERRPDLVRGLLLAAPAGIGSGARAARAAILVTGYVRPGRWVAPFRHRYASRVWYRRALFRPWFVSDPLAVSPRATLGFLEGSAEHADVRTAGRALVADDPRRDLERVRCPVMIVWGARDPQLPLGDAFEYARRLRAKLRVVADCGHLVIGERPHACLDALEALERL
ncbi:MAG: alpha/beta fold hydrolase [Actinobacteria bacterium]|nr:alpha/beta fold hydrolase [Actinomycetota bacterium]